MGKATTVYNGKNILRVLLGLSFYRIPRLPPWHTNFVPPSRNTDQLLQINVNKFFILVVFL